MQATFNFAFGGGVRGINFLSGMGGNKIFGGGPLLLLFQRPINVLPIIFINQFNHIINSF